MMGAFWLLVFCFIWLMGLSLVAEIWFSEEEEQM
jgi:hypothetical protein